MIRTTNPIKKSIGSAHNNQQTLDPVAGGGEHTARKKLAKAEAIMLYTKYSATKCKYTTFSF